MKSSLPYFCLPLCSVSMNYTCVQFYFIFLFRSDLICKSCFILFSWEKKKWLTSRTLPLYLNLHFSVVAIPQGTPLPYPWVQWRAPPFDPNQHYCHYSTNHGWRVWWEKEEASFAATRVVTFPINSDPVWKKIDKSEDGSSGIDINNLGFIPTLDWTIVQKKKYLIEPTYWNW